MAGNDLRVIYIMQKGKGNRIVVHYTLYKGEGNRIAVSSVDR